MSHILSSAYAGLSQLLIEAGHFISPAELQGSLWGRTVAGADTSSEKVLQDIVLILDDGELTEAIKQAIVGLQAMVSKELIDDSVTVTLLLPDDEVSLNDRLQALISWVHGFLSGFGMVQTKNQLSAEGLEILQDLAAITQLELSIAKEDEARSEGDYMELVEFLRVVPLLMNAQLTTQDLTAKTALNTSIH